MTRSRRIIEQNKRRQAFLKRLAAQPQRVLSVRAIERMVEAMQPLVRAVQRIIDTFKQMVITQKTEVQP